MSAPSVPNGTDRGAPMADERRWIVLASGHGSRERPDCPPPLHTRAEAEEQATRWVLRADTIGGTASVVDVGEYVATLYDENRRLRALSTGEPSQGKNADSVHGAVHVHHAANKYDDANKTGGNTRGEPSPESAALLDEWGERVIAHFTRGMSSARQAAERIEAIGKSRHARAAVDAHLAALTARGDAVERDAEQAASNFDMMVEKWDQAERARVDLTARVEAAERERDDARRQCDEQIADKHRILREYEAQANALRARLLPSGDTGR